VAGGADGGVRVARQSTKGIRFELKGFGFYAVLKSTAYLL